MPAPHVFMDRARLYAQLDRRLARQTRFFAAAAVTNAALMHLYARRKYFPCVSDSTLSFLSSAGGFLESANLRWAGWIEAARQPVRGLDRELVSVEQSLLEALLLRLRHTDATHHSRLICQVDRVLAWLAIGTVLPASSLSLRTLAHVLCRVTDRLGRAASFSIREDRVRIGCSLIGHLRVQYASAGELARHLL